MRTKVNYEVSLKKGVARVSRNCDEKYARKLLQDWLKKNTRMKGGWEVVKDFDRWKDPEVYYFDIRNIFFPNTTDFRNLQIFNEELAV